MILAMSIIFVFLAAGLVVVILTWQKSNTLLAGYDEIGDVDVFHEQRENESKRLQEQLETRIGQHKKQLKKYMDVAGVIKSATEPCRSLN